MVVQHGSHEDPRVPSSRLQSRSACWEGVSRTRRVLQCHLSGGKHTCIEKDIEIVPREKIVTVLAQDTFGISKVLSDYRVETTFQKLGDFSTKMEISHYYSTTTLKAKFLNIIAKGKIDRETQATLTAIKATIEADRRTAYGLSPVTTHLETGDRGKWRDSVRRS